MTTNENPKNMYFDIKSVTSIPCRGLLLLDKLENYKSSQVAMPDAALCR